MLTLEQLKPSVYKKGIGKNVKLQLINSLDFRNGCGHPNSLKIGPNMVASHIELLVKNVYLPFS